VHEDLPGEQWLGLVAHPGYDVSSRGRLRSYRAAWRNPRLAGEPRMVSAKLIKRTGYLMYSFSNNGRYTPRVVHAVVLEAFVGPRPDGMECRHLDDNRTNNSVENLCWGTRQENVNDRIRHGNYARKLTKEDIPVIRERLASGMKQKDVAKIHGVSQAQISEIATGKNWAHVA
jgi:hypothetical protein